MAMIEIAFFLFVAWILLKLPQFAKTPPEDRLVCWGTVLTSMLDDKPFEWKPGSHQDPEPDNTDPNSNPHYVWAEEDTK